MSVMLKIQFNRDLNYGIFKNKKRLFPVTLKALFLTLTLMTLNFGCYRKD